MCYDNCSYFRKDTETCRLPKGTPCPYDEDTSPAWPPTAEEYGSYCVCRGCEYELEGEDYCILGDPKENCIRKLEIMKECYPHDYTFKI